MPYYPRSRNTERDCRNARFRVSPYMHPYPRTNSKPDQNTQPPPLMSSLISIIPAKVKETADAATQTIPRDKNLDPINFARLYISTQISGQSIEEKRTKFYDDESLNENIRRSYRKFVEEHNNNDDKSKLTKVDRKYHLLDRSLNTKMLEMTSDQIKKEYPGIGWDYLGLQARMEYQQRDCNQLSEAVTDERFFQDRNILTNLKIGYSRWKSDNIYCADPTVLCIDKSSQYPHNQRYNNYESNTKDNAGISDDVPVSELLIDQTLNTNILSLSVDDIETTYGSISKDILGLQARVEYAKNYEKYQNQVNEIVHNIDIDFMLDEQIPRTVRSWYRQWLSANQLIKKQDQLFVVKITDKVEKLNRT